jgi:succinate-acetate transporter protein
VRDFTKAIKPEMTMEKTANPAPLGLMGFGMTTVLLNIHNAGFFPISSMILAMGLFYGGIAQIIAGILEFKKGNTFGMTAFVSYGAFWITLVGLIVGPRTGWVDRTPEGFMGCFLAMWGIFTLFMFFGTLRANRALQFVFLSLTVLFFLLAIRDFAESPLVGVIAGWEGILCGASAIYLAMAEVLSEQFGRDVLPIGRPRAVVISSVPSSLPAVASGAR